MANPYLTTSTNLANFYTIGATFGATGSYGTTIGSMAGSNGTYWGANGNVTIGTTTPAMNVKGDLDVEGALTVNGRDLSKLMEKIEDRLAILAEPNPDRLEKFPALKKAYDHYKLMEKLIGAD
jgi:hypothetical protein